MILKKIDEQYLKDRKEFSDKYEDKPITEMDKILKEMTTKRNYDIKQINNKIIHDENWLKPQETSIKTEKINFKEEQPIGSKLKYLKPDNEILNSSIKKTVTWGNNIERSDLEFEESIFKKLKKIQPVADNININYEDININEINNQSYEDKIKVLELEVKTLNTKLDMIIELLKKNN
jgi:hypothetical protein